MSRPRPRAAPLSPEDRRASIIAATVPLLRTRGAEVTTAQIAMAAGVAEGTLFRVFPDKESLIRAAIETAFDPCETDGALERIDPSLDLRATLIAAVEIIRRRVESIWQLIAILGRTTPSPIDPRRMMQRAPTSHDAGTRRALIALFERHRDEVRCEPEVGARILRIMTFAATHPRINDGPILTAAEIVAVVLDGIRTRPDLEVT